MGWWVCWGLVGDRGGCWGRWCGVGGAVCGIAVDGGGAGEVKGRMAGWACRCCGRQGAGRGSGVWGRRGERRRLVGAVE